MAIRKRLIGYGVTDSNGVAQSTYTGKGYGEIDVQAEVKGEMLFHYIGTGGTETDTWSAQTGSGAVTITSDSGGTTFTSTGSGAGWIWANKQGVTPSTTQGVWTGDFTIELDVVSMTGTANVTVYESSVTGAKSQTFALSIGHWKVTRNGSTFTVTHDGATSIVTKALTDPVRIGITHIQSGKAVTFKNFAIYKYNGDLLSDEKQIMDYIAYDNGTSADHNDIWTFTRCTMSRTDEYTTFIQSESGTSSVYLINNFTYTIPIDSDWCMEFDLKTDNQIGIYLKSANTSAVNFGYWNTQAMHRHIFKYDSATNKVSHYMNTSTTPYQILDMNTKTEPLRFYITDWQGDLSIKMKNFKIYPI